MFDKIQHIQKEIDSFKASSLKEVEQLRINLIINVSVSIVGLIVFVMVKNYIRKKIQFYLEEKNKKTKED